MFQNAVVVCSVKNLAVDAPVASIGNPLVVFFARCASVSSDRCGSLRSRHDERVYTIGLTYRIQRTEAAGMRC